MTHLDLTSKDRSFAAMAGVSGTPNDTPPETPTRAPSNANTDGTKPMPLPRSAFYIIVVEGCERFCFYGLKTVLLLYFMNFLLLSKDSATVGYHLFSFACYFMPTIGAIISDGFIGRYSTILFLSVFYLLGTVILTFTATPMMGRQQLTGSVLGLALIAIGTGGIKPCVSAFGADQISSANPRQLSRYFALFYFAINCGSLTSTLLTPLLRSKVHCFGYDCYALAFGVPAALMLTAIIIYLSGTPLYKRIPPKENIIVKFIAIVLRAMRNALCGSSSGRRSDWLYYADDKYSTDDISEVRAVLHVCLLFTPIPVFFALFDQSGSRWTYQASLMNGSLGPFGTIQPDQMQALNSLFVLAFIPLFEEVLYPAFARFNFLIRPLQRMFCGMLLMIFAFVMAAIVQLAIQASVRSIPVRTDSQIFNGYKCAINITQHRTLNVEQTSFIPCKTLMNEGIIIASTCDKKQLKYKLLSTEECPTVLVVSEDNGEGSSTDMTLTPLTAAIGQGGRPPGSALLRLVSLDGAQSGIKIMPNNYHYQLQTKLIPTDYKPILANRYQIENMKNGQMSEHRIKIYNTAIYTGLVYNNQKNKVVVTLFEDVSPSTVHMLWQTFQYILLTCAEMLVSITGLTFAYSQAPRRYKSVIMSAWLMTTAMGDLIVALVAQVRLVRNQAMEFILFAVLMALATLFFGILALNYRETKHDEKDSEDQQLIIDRNAPEPDDALPLTN